MPGTVLYGLHARSKVRCYICKGGVLASTAAVSYIDVQGLGDENGTAVWVEQEHIHTPLCRPRRRELRGFSFALVALH